jgi:hypothetical protein
MKPKILADWNITIRGSYRKNVLFMSAIAPAVEPNAQEKRFFI